MTPPLPLQPRRFKARGGDQGKVRTYRMLQDEAEELFTSVVETYTMKITSRCTANPQIKMGDSEDQTLLFAQPLELRKVNASPGEENIALRLLQMRTSQTSS